MLITTAKRVIRYKNQDLADLNPKASINDVVRMHAPLHPELATAIVTGPVMEKGKAVYGIETRVGTKG